jgi:hypothetical protein
VFPVRYELDLYMLFRRNSVFKGIIGLQWHKVYINFVKIYQDFNSGDTQTHPQREYLTRTFFFQLRKARNIKIADINQYLKFLRYGLLPSYNISSISA